MSSANNELAGDISIKIVPYQGNTLVDMKAMVNASFAEFEKNGVTDDDLARFKGITESKYINSLASISIKVKELTEDQTFTGNPNQIGKKLDEIQNVTKADIMRVYLEYIKGKSSVILSILPKGGSIQPVKPDNYTVEQNGYKAPDYGYAGLIYHKATEHFDRNIQPAAGPNPVIKVPPYWMDNTVNGIKLMGSYNDEIPTVFMSISIMGGGLLAAKDPSKAGLPNIVAALLNEGTKNYTAEQMDAQWEKLGSNIGVNAVSDATSFYVTSLTKNLDATLLLLQERLFHPNFTEEALERVKKQVIQDFQTAKTRPYDIASSVFNKIIYGKNNIRTYGLLGNEQTVPNITLQDVQAYYDNFFAPNLTSIVVVGNIGEKQIKAKLAFLDNWKEKQVEIAAADTTTKPASINTVFLVDVPHAPQSEIRIGYATGLNYDATGTYYKLGFVNYVLGGGFDSRLNMDLRERKGWTYGARSWFSSDKYGGIFVASAAVKASVTDSSVVEFLKDINHFADKGITPAELNFTKSSIGQSDALLYETNYDKASFLATIQEYHLKADFVAEQNAILSDINVEQINELARKYLNPSRMSILVVGDKDKVMPGLRKFGFTVVELDADGNIK